VSNFPPNPRDPGPPPPGLSPDYSDPTAVPCTRCGHRAGSHRAPGPCRARARWWRRCPCPGYLGFDSADPGSA